MNICGLFDFWIEIVLVVVKYGKEPNNPRSAASGSEVYWRLQRELRELNFEIGNQEN